MLEEDEEGQVLPSIEDLASDAHTKLPKNIIMQKKTKMTKRGQHEILQVGLNGHRPTKAK
jgi:hypothetical protein